MSMFIQREIFFLAYMVQALQNVYQAEKNVLQVAVPVKMPRDDAWHEME